MIFKERAKNSGRFAVIFTIFLLMSGSTTVAQDVQRFVSSKAGDRITPKPVVRFEQNGNSSTVEFAINDEITHQRIDGFGASFLEAGLICLNSLPQRERESVLRALFDPESGRRVLRDEDGNCLYGFHVSGTLLQL